MIFRPVTRGGHRHAELVAARRRIAELEAELAIHRRSAELLAKEREIFAAQAQESGKPVEIIEKMVEGRLRKYLAEVTLVGQPFVKDPDTTVGKLLKSKGAKAVRFERMEVGEGIEKKSEDFAAEVMAQARKVSTHSFYSTPTASQLAACRALDGRGDAWIGDYRGERIVSSGRVSDQPVTNNIDNLIGAGQ